MISRRLRIATFIALSCPLAAFSQSGSTSGSSGSSSSGSTAPTSSFSSTISPPSNTSGTGASSSFGTSGSGSSGGSTFDIFGGGTGTTNGTPAPAPESAPPSFTLPGFYGQGPTTFFGGTGRLARPDFEIGMSFSIGYDDNIFQTPSKTFGFGGAQFVDPGTPNAVEVPGEERRTVIIGFRDRFEGGQFVRREPIFDVEPGTPSTFVVEPTPPQERVGSFLTRSNLNLQMQNFTRRSLFTLDLSGGRTYYWEKDEDPVDYNANFSVSYLYKITPRLQTTAQFNTAYLSQPDLSRINTPERPTVGDIINTLGRVDVSYRLTPRISTTFSTSYSGNRYTEKTEEVNNYDQWTLGLEARYLWRPRWTLLAEVRHNTTTYDQQPRLNSTTNYFLVGTEFILSARLTGSLRVGMNFKQFDVGTNQSAPYVESSVAYRSTARSTISWNNRFGFEEAGSPDEERLVYRSTIGYTYAFTPRLKGFANINLLHEISTNTVTNTEFAQDTFDSTIGLDYQITKRFGLNASYAFTIVNSNTGTNDYYRNRLYFGGQLNF
jgi:Putative beta-barrel porin 2